MRNAAIVLLLLSVVAVVADGPAMLATNPPIYYEPGDPPIYYYPTDNTDATKDSAILTVTPSATVPQEIMSISSGNESVQINIAATAVYTMTIAKDGAVRIVIDK